MLAIPPKYPRRPLPSSQRPKRKKPKMLQFQRLRHRFLKGKLLRSSPALLRKFEVFQKFTDFGSEGGIFKQLITSCFY